MAELPRLDPLSAEYVALSFAIERHVPGYVDAYVGPPSVRDAAAGEPVAEPERLLHRAQSFMARIADARIPDTRVGYLSAQAQAMIATCRRLAGENVTFADEVRLLFDVPAERVPEADFDAAIAQVDRLLPGDGAIPERMAAWRRTLEVAPERAMAVVEAIVPALRERTETIVVLPDREAVEFRLVSDEPWGGYNWFLGQGRSRVELNTDLPIHAHHLLDLICHEAYPGHHVEHALKERLYLDQGWGEHAIQLINTPECVISEGIATQAASAIFPGDELSAFQAERVYPAAGVDLGISAEAVEQIAAAERVLLAARGNAALMHHADGVPDDEVIAYLRRYRLRTMDEARQDLRFIADPLWRAYTFTYHVGYDLLGAWIDRAADPTERAIRFRTLVSEQVYPSRIEAWIAEEAADARS